MKNLLIVTMILLLMGCAVSGNQPSSTTVYNSSNGEVRTTKYDSGPIPESTIKQRVYY